MKPSIFNIQKFSLHDGPGIRTTVFFKGCPLRCWWCHNPESQCFNPEYMMEPVGEYYTVRELIKLLKKDQIFYDQSGGGVTISGGEVMDQDMDYVEEV
ncbi:MAG: radical SAM protein, partial [Firmicutes bacterium]|nr:radical SAM protein [Bacillota bacterium]